MLNKLSSHKLFGGQQLQFEHVSACLHCTMKFSVYLPPQAEHGPVPALYWLSGLTCTDDNFSYKAGAQRYAAQHGIALIIPDTSPRGSDVPDDAEGAYDFGLGAGFYVNATEPVYATHYHMYDYIVNELPQQLEAELPITQLRSISGHSMGGHGALVIALRNSHRYRSVSAFAPIVNPSDCPWGIKAFSGYLGSNREAWSEYDSVRLIEKGYIPPPMLIDQGDSDNFLTSQLRPERLQHACQQAGIAAPIRMQPGYDHSYYFVASFIGEHIAFHAQHLHND
jgi:S-formylglutathione hydrolase